MSTFVYVTINIKELNIETKKQRLQNVILQLKLEYVKLL